MNPLQSMEILKPFIGPSQMAAVRSGLRSEERQFFADKLASLAQLVIAMPKTCETDEQGQQAIAHLHYFAGGHANWYITETDKGDGSGDKSQHQAFGLADFYGHGNSDWAELGYISIAEIIATGGELDFCWTPKTLGEIKAVKE